MVTLKINHVLVIQKYLSKMKESPSSPVQTQSSQIQNSIFSPRDVSNYPYNTDVSPSTDTHSLLRMYSLQLVAKECGASSPTGYV